MNEAVANEAVARGSSWFLIISTCVTKMAIGFDTASDWSGRDVPRAPRRVPDGVHAAQGAQDGSGAFRFACLIAPGSGRALAPPLRTRALVGRATLCWCSSGTTSGQQWTDQGTNARDLAHPIDCFPQATYHAVYHLRHNQSRHRHAPQPLQDLELESSWTAQASTHSPSVY